MTNIQLDDNLTILNYSGIFLSCFADFSEKCIHANAEHVLVYLYAGEHIIEDGNEKTTLLAGDCVFIRRDHRLKMYKNSKGDELYKAIALTFKRGVLREFYNKMDKNSIPKQLSISDEKVFKLDTNPAIASLFQSLTPYFDSNVKPAEEITHLKLLEGIHVLLNSNTMLHPILFDFADPWKIDILEFMNESYMDELSMEEIASFTGRSLATFKRDFKKISELTPQRWLIKKRLEAAYFKLKEEGRKVQDVYMEVGFKNPSHFSTAFKKQYGVPPTDVFLSL